MQIPFQLYGFLNRAFSRTLCRLTLARTVVVCCVLLCCTLVNAQESEERSDNLRVLVWNVWHAGNDVDNGQEKILALIKEHNVDICLLQESYDIDGPRPKLGKWLAGELEWNQFQGDSAHLCVLTRFPVEETFFHHAWHGVGARLNIAPDRSLVAYSIWIDYRSPIDEYLKANPKATDEEVLASETDRSGRLKQANGLISHLESTGRLDEEVPLLVGGDWNCPSHLDWTEKASEHFDWRRPLKLPVSLAMKEAGFTDAYRAIHPDPVEHPGLTWSPLFRVDDEGNPKPSNRIDRLYTKNPDEGATLVPVRATVFPEVLEDNEIPVRERAFPSDHAAVLIELEWK